MLVSFLLENTLHGSYAGVFHNQTENNLPELNYHSCQILNIEQLLFSKVSVVMIPILQILKTGQINTS